MDIPKRFNLLGHEIKVNIKSTHKLRDNNMGEAFIMGNEITLQQSTPDYYIARSVMEQTYIHEVVHYILAYMGEDELGNNEKWVDTFAGMLTQVLNTSKGVQ